MLLLLCDVSQLLLVFLERYCELHRGVTCPGQVLFQLINPCFQLPLHLKRFLQPLVLVGVVLSNFHGLCLAKLRLQILYVTSHRVKQLTLLLHLRAGHFGSPSLKCKLIRFRLPSLDGVLGDLSRVFPAPHDVHPCKE